MRIFIIVLSFLLLVSCAPAGSGKPVSITDPQIALPKLSYLQLRQNFKDLTSAQVSETDPLVVLYPTSALFSETAVLPMPGGAGQLDALASLIRQSGLSWQLNVRADAGEGDAYDILLAEQRVKVLRAYFQSVGVDLKKIYIKAVTGAGAPLEMKVVQ